MSLTCVHLQYGPPGSGKTSLIRSLAGELGLDVYMVTLSRPSLDDNTLYQLIDLPERCIALMEDIDVTFRHDLSQRAAYIPAESHKISQTSISPTVATATTASHSDGVSLSVLLNALDGIAAQEGHILFATTNDYGALDPALCRPGRMDVHIEFHHADQSQAEELFRAFYSLAGGSVAEGDGVDETLLLAQNEEKPHPGDVQTPSRSQ